MAEGDGDRMAPVPHYEGVTDEQLKRQEVGRAAFDAQKEVVSAELDKYVKMAEREADELELVKHIADLVVPIISSAMARHAEKANVPDTPGLRQQLIGGVLDVWKTPKPERGAALTAMLQGILGGLAR